MKKNRYVNTKYAKSRDYGKVISAIATVGHCPFCKENFKYHKKPILKKLNGWMLTENSWPYKNTQKHFIIISPLHKEQLGELTTKDFLSLLTLSKWAVKKYNLKGGGFTLRFGNTNFTGATVAHLHAHLIYPQTGKNGLGKSVNFPIG